MNALNKALDILEVFTESSNNRPLRLTEVARLSGKNKVTAKRLMAILVARGYLSQPGKRGKYSLGPKLLSLNHSIKENGSVKDIAKEYMIKLNEILSETVVLAGWDGKEAHFLGEVNTKYPFSPLRIIPDQNSITPLYCTSAGKIFLATMTGKELDEYFQNTKIEARTPNTITNVTLIKTHLMLVAQEGIAYDDEELYIGVRNVGAPIRNSRGEVSYAVSVTCPVARMDRTRMTEIAPDVKRCAIEISRALGYSPK
jgi:DNA-binding IclR family transcriptional regulator